MGLLPLWVYATGFLVLLPRPKRLAGARRRPSQFAMVVASLMGGLVAFVGLCDGVSGLFSSPQKTCRGAPAPLRVRNGLCVANGRACCLCGFYATASLGLFPCPKRLAGARRRPCTPGQGQLPLVPRKKNSPYLVSRLLHPLLRAPPPILTRLPRRLRSRRPCGPFFFIAGLASCAFSLPPPWLHPLT